MTTDGWLKQMTEDERCKAKFIGFYGKIGEHYDEETWMERLGIWTAGWEEAVSGITEYLEQNIDSFEKMITPTASSYTETLISVARVNALRRTIHFLENDYDNETI